MTRIIDCNQSDDLSGFIGWVRDCLDYTMLSHFLDSQGRRGADCHAAKWRSYQRDPLGFLVQWGDPLAAWYLKHVWPAEMIHKRIGGEE